MSTIQKYQRKNLIVNGSVCPILCEDRAKLSEVIRNQLNLTGTKVGCKAGQCGICSVLVDGKLVRSCVTMMKNVPDGASILTIEGVGTREHLHPIQAAFVKTGAPQCGFCTPGFIMSSIALLNENPNPTRQEVRKWFADHKNICRCTGYKPIVDAVMLAAAVMRGERPEADLYETYTGGKMVGGRFSRPNAVSKVLGTHDFGGDTMLKMPEGALHIALVQAEVSHANILSIDTSEAEKMPGVAYVLTHKDVPGTNILNGFGAMPGSKTDTNDRPILCSDKVYQYGDAIAMVLADTKAQAEAAAKLVKVELEELPAYMSAEEAIADDAIEIHPGTPNITFEANTIKGGETEPIIASAPYVVNGTYRTSRQPHLILEPDVGYAFFDENENLTLCVKSIACHVNKPMVASGVGIPEEKLRIIQNNMGATFGYKCALTNEGLLGVAAMVSGRPVMLEFSMYQQITYTGKRAPMEFDMTLAADETGKIVALQDDHLVDHGAYSSGADDVTYKTMVFIGLGYDIPNVRAHSRVTYTNHAYCTAFRSYASTQVMFATESLVDELAEKVGMDPLEFRYRNVLRPGEVTSTGQVPDTYSLAEQIDWIRPRYQEALARAKARSTDEKKYGVGVSVAAYSAGDHMYDYCAAEVELTATGVTVYNCWQDHGQGSDLGTVTMVHDALYDALHLHPDQIKLVMNDTGKTLDGGISAGSRGNVMFGNAMIVACENLLKAMRKEDGTYRTYEEMVAEGIPTKYEGNFNTSPYVGTVDWNTMQGNPIFSFMFGIAMSEVEVDMKTGKTVVEKMTLSCDCGTIINKCTVDGQMAGGLAQALGLALREDFEDLAKHTNLVRCGVPAATDIPDDIVIEYFETKRPHGPYGSSGVGELPLSSPHASITNAIKNACGVRITHLPALPEKVLAELKKKA